MGEMQIDAAIKLFLPLHLEMFWRRFRHPCLTRLKEPPAGIGKINPASPAMRQVGADVDIILADNVSAFWANKSLSIPILHFHFTSRRTSYQLNGRHPKAHTPGKTC